MTSPKNYSKGPYCGLRMLICIVVGRSSDKRVRTDTGIYHKTRSRVPIAIARVKGV